MISRPAEMGNTVSIDPRHTRIWQNLNVIQSNQTRMQMLDTLMSGPEYIQSAKRAGIYAAILQWKSTVQRGEFAVWPGSAHAYVSRADPRIPNMNPPRKVVKENTELATVPPPKRALDTLHDSYLVLGIDDTKQLSHESLRAAYRKASIKAHPDRGGSPAAFDIVTRAYLYLEEVLNKLIPRTAQEGDDKRFTAPVTKEAAMKAREVPLTRAAAERASAGSDLPVLEDKPPVSLNPKNLNMSVFNQLFEENRLPDPQNDGYGDWLKSNGEDIRTQSNDTLRSKFNSDIFNKMFSEQGSARQSEGHLAKYQQPNAITLTGGTELGAGKQLFTAPMGSKTKYTDLMYAYGEGSTFSQEVAGVQTETRNFDQIKREREAAPVPLRSEEMAAVQSIERQRKLAEEDRQRRMAAQDVDTENVYTRMQRRLLVQ